MDSRGSARIFSTALLATACVLGWRASRPDVWSEWAFGDAQTMMTLEHWKRDGILAHRGLFLPQGVSEMTRLLDDPALSHHAHGVNPHSAPGIPRRVYYTHYPPGYLLPFHGLYSMGLQDPQALGLLSISLSLGAAWLWFLLFRDLAGPLGGLAAGLFYLGSPLFQGFAHALANQPVDDLLRAAIALAAFRQAGTGLLWLLGFLLASCSLDSHLLAAAWVVGIDLERRRAPCWGRWALLATAPLLAHGLQFLQNAAYMGLDGAVRDAGAAFLRQSPAGGSPVHEALAGSVKGLLPLPGPWMGPALFLAVIGAGLWALEGARPRLGLALLLAGGAAFLAALPRAGHMGYQGRQLLPCLSLAAGACAASWRRTLPGVLAAAACLASFRETGERFRTGLVRFQEFPVLRFAKDLGNSLEGDRVFLALDAFPPEMISPFDPDFPQAHPLLEYYARGPILGFRDPDLLARDLLRLRELGGRRFRPVLLAESGEALAAVWRALRLRSPGLPEAPPAGLLTYRAPGRPYFVLDLPDLPP